jgi:DNA polymerase elongation subunit (family B)
MFQVLDIVESFEECGVSKNNVFYLVGRTILGDRVIKKDTRFSPFFAYFALPKEFDPSFCSKIKSELNSRLLFKYKNIDSSNCRRTNCKECSPIKLGRLLCSEGTLKVIKYSHCPECDEIANQIWHEYLFTYPQCCSLPEFPEVNVDKIVNTECKINFIEFFITSLKKTKAICNGKCQRIRDAIFEWNHGNSQSEEDEDQDEKFSVNVNLCPKQIRIDAENSEEAISSITVTNHLPFSGYEKDPRTFLRFQFTRSYYCDQKTILNYFKYKFLLDDTTLLEHQRGLFEMNKNPLEMYMRETKIYGGCWLNIDTLELIKEENIPELNARIKTLCFDIETPTAYSKRFPSPIHGIRIASIAILLVEQNVFYTLITTPYQNKEESVDKSKLTGHVECFQTEYELLKRFHTIYMENDPDFITGYNSNTFDFPYVLERMRILGMEEWNQWSVLSNEPLRAVDTSFSSKQNGSRKLFKYFCAGRCFFDAYDVIANDKTIKTPIKKLGHIAKYLKLSSQKDDLHHTLLWEYYVGDSEKRTRFLHYNQYDVTTTNELIDVRSMIPSLFANCQVYKIIPRQETERGISYKISRMMHYETYPTYLRQSSEYVYTTENDTTTSFKMFPRIFKLIKKELEFRGIKIEDNQILRVAKVDLQGGFVKIPIPDYHTGYFIFVFDFNSLYPSIIRAHNMCHTTLLPNEEYARGLGLIEGVDYEKTLNGTLFVLGKTREGILPKMLTKLTNIRNQFKKQLKDPKVANNPVLKKTVDSKQNAVKIASNSSYGQCGMPQSEISMMILADAVCSSGRNYIVSVMEYMLSCENFKAYGPTIIYGDTDSLFVKTNIPVVGTNIDDARRVFKYMADNINVDSKILIDPMKIGCDSLNYAMDIGEQKKMYVRSEVSLEIGAPDECEVVAKGISLVKGNAVDYLKQIAQEFLDNTIGTKTPWSKEQSEQYLRDSLQYLLNGKVEPVLLTTSTKMSKNIEDYGKTTQHVEVAKELQKSGIPIFAGDTIQYYFYSKDKTKGAIACQLWSAEKYPLDYIKYFEAFKSSYFDMLCRMIGRESTNRLFNLRRYTISITSAGETQLTKSLNIHRPPTEYIRNNTKGGEEEPTTYKQQKLDSFFTVPETTQVLVKKPKEKKDLANPPSIYSFFTKGNTKVLG